MSQKPQNPKCPRCGKAVYHAERVLGAGKEWHRSCLTCYQCNKVSLIVIFPVFRSQRLDPLFHPFIHTRLLFVNSLNYEEKTFLLECVSNEICLTAFG
jgi:hypothetical protein